MSVPIGRVYILILILFGSLVGFTSWWSVIKADDLRQQTTNKRPLLEERRIRRGNITTTDGVLVARSQGNGKGSQRFFSRVYPEASLFGHPVGYDFLDRGRAGVERSENDILVGRSNEFVSIIDSLRGASQQGSNIKLTLSAEAQRLGRDLLAGQNGSIVAIEPATGAVRAMVSSPEYDPNQVPDEFGELSQAPNSPLLARATQSQYPPGSTMKVVTAAAALDSGEFTPESVLNGSSPQDISGVPLENSGNAQFGEISLTTALTNSVNTVWAQVGEQLGDETMFKYMQRFGFFTDPPIHLPDSELRPSGIYARSGTRQLEAGDGIDIGRVAIGQERLGVTPLQMAMVASAVANDGDLMRPELVEEVTDPDGRVTDELDPDVFSEPISSETAAQLQEMMANVVNDGTASGALGGVDAAGKTGTAEINTDGLNQPWFIGFAPVDEPRIAVAVTIERLQGGSGGGDAAPLARSIMEIFTR